MNLCRGLDLLTDNPIMVRKSGLQELLAMQGDEPLVIDKTWDNMPAVGQEVPLGAARFGSAATSWSQASTPRWARSSKAADPALW